MDLRSSICFLIILFNSWAPGVFECGGDDEFKAHFARLIQNGFTGEAKTGEARKADFSRLLVHFNPDLQNGFMLQCLDLRKIDEAEVGISHVKEALS